MQEKESMTGNENFQFLVQCKQSLSRTENLICMLLVKDIYNLILLNIYNIHNLL